MQKKSKLTSLISLIFVATLLSLATLVFLNSKKGATENTSQTEEVSVPIPSEIPLPSPVGLYVSDLLPSASSPGRQYTLELSGDAITPRATLAIDFRDGKEQVTKRGIWKVSDPQTVFITLTEKNGGAPLDDEEDFTFNKKGKTLMLTDYDLDTWGSSGLTLIEQEYPQRSDPLSETFSLSETSWEWVKTEIGSGTVVQPKNPEVFILTFLNDTQFGVTTDCNRAGGSYSQNEHTLIFFKNLFYQNGLPGRNS